MAEEMSGTLFDLSSLDGFRVKLTAIEAAELLVPDLSNWRRRETIRRRVQELENPYKLLEVVGEREGARSKADNQVYAITDLGRLAVGQWDTGIVWQPHHLARSSDPETAKKAVRKMHPQKDFHRVCYLYLTGMVLP